MSPHSNATISPTHQTLMIAGLERLDGVDGRAELVRSAAANTEDEQDAIFWDMTARMLADIHARGPKLAKITLLDVFPVAVGQDGVDAHDASDHVRDVGAVAGVPASPSG